jgi:hypothetical protein
MVKEDSAEVFEMKSRLEILGKQVIWRDEGTTYLYGRPSPS